MLSHGYRWKVQSEVERGFEAVDLPEAISDKLCRALRHGPSIQTSQEQAECIGVGGSLGSEAQEARGEGLATYDILRGFSGKMVRLGIARDRQVCDGTWMAKTLPRPATELVRPPNILAWACR